MLLLDVSISFGDGAVARRILLGTYDVTVEKCCSRQCMITAMTTRLIGGRQLRLQNYTTAATCTSSLHCA